MKNPVMPKMKMPGQNADVDNEIAESPENNDPFNASPKAANKGPFPMKAKKVPGKITSLEQLKAVAKNFGKKKKMMGKM